MSDKNGLTLRHAEILRQSIADAKISKKFFKKGSALIRDVFND